MNLKKVNDKLESISEQGCDGFKRLIGNIKVYEDTLNGDSECMKEKFCKIPELFWEILGRGIDDKKFIECSCFFDLMVFKKEFLNISSQQYDKSGEDYFNYKMTIILEFSAAKEFHKIPKDY